jgi:hypothetical protein
MLKTVVLLAFEVGVVVLGRSVLWRHLLRRAGEGRVSQKNAYAVATSLIRTSGHMWVLLGLVPTAVLIDLLISLDRVDAASAELLAVGAAGLIAWCGWKASLYYRLALRLRRRRP